MERIEKRNAIITVAVCICLSMAIAFGMTVFATQGYPTSGYLLYANAGLSIEETGGFIYLSTPENSSNSWAKLKCFYKQDFSQINQFSFDYYRITGTITPYLIIELDTDLNGWPDLWLVQWPKKLSKIPASDNEWHTYSEDNWQYSPGGEGGNWNLSELKNIFAGDVRGIKVAIGNWESLYAHEYYINNLTINGETLINVTPVITPTPTPFIPVVSPTPEVVYIYRGGGGGYPRDTDGDGLSDVKEMLAGTDWKDPCDPNPECAACLAIRPSAPTPTPIITPVPTATPIIPVETPVPAEITKPTPTPEPEIPGFEVVFAILGLLTVVYFWMRRKERRNN